MKLKKTYHNPARAGLLAALAAVALIGSASAATNFISINNTGSGGMTATDLAGAPGVRVTNWNNTSGTATLSSATYSDGTAVSGGFSVAFTTTGSAPARSAGAVTNDSVLYGSDFNISGTSSSVSVAVTDIPFANYDVYVYMAISNGGRGGSFTIGSTTYFARGIANPDSTGSGYVLSTDTTAGTAGLNTDWDQGNYVKFSNLSGTSFSLDALAPAMGDTVNPRNEFAGFQIVQVPEPSSVAFLGALGCLALLRRRR